MTITGGIVLVCLFGYAVASLLLCRRVSRPRVGDPFPEPGQDHDEWFCGAFSAPIDAQGGHSWRCTRPASHTGRHAAAVGDEIVAVWKPTTEGSTHA